MGGEVGVDSTPGQGSRFWFRVPLERLAEGSDTRSTPRGTTMLSPVSQHLAGRVLIVEDHADNQAVIRALLEQIGIESVIAANGQLGVERFIAEAEHIDAIVMDIQMPVLDGYAATEHIRAWEREHQRPATPIIALTANAFAENRERCLQAGMDAYLAKPVDLATLTATLVPYLPTPDTAAVSESTAPLQHAVDWADFTVQAHALLPLLAQSKFDALEHFAALEARFAQTPLAEELAALRPQIHAFRFAQAHEMLERILANAPHLEAVD
jgi:CheY-like chemotaxis protein